MFFARFVCVLKVRHEELFPVWLILNLFLIIVHGCDIFIFVLRPLCGRIALAWICAGCPVLETCLGQFASDQTKMLAERMADLVGFCHCSCSHFSPCLHEVCMAE